MDEVPLMFDLPLTRSLNEEGEMSVTLKTTGHERTHFILDKSCHQCDVSAKDEAERKTTESHRWESRKEKEERRKLEEEH